jgi:hypothetical protein
MNIPDILEVTACSEHLHKPTVLQFFLYRHVLTENQRTSIRHRTSRNCDYTLENSVPAFLNYLA